MRQIADLLRREPHARWFFLTSAQSSIGTGAGYIALVLLAYERFPSPWAITLVLLAEFVPAMFFGPLFGATADRWSRRWCAVAGDVARALAFLALAAVGSFELTVVFALLAGVGTGLFTPAILAALPTLVDERRVPAATSLYGAVADVGYTVGPALAAGFLIFSTPEMLVIANGLTFGLSAIVLSLLPFGARAPSADRSERPSLFRETTAGLRATAGMPALRVIVLASSAVFLFAGILNVAELLLAKEELGTDESGFAVLVAFTGIGVLAGTVLGAKGGEIRHLKDRYLVGLLVFGLGLVGSGLAPLYGIALVTFLIAGLGNGLVLVYERLLIQRTVPDSLMGRVFGVRDALGAWAFAIAFVAAGALLSVVGSRTLLVLAGLGALAVWGGSLFALRERDLDPRTPLAASDDDPARSTSESQAVARQVG